MAVAVVPLTPRGPAEPRQPAESLKAPDPQPFLVELPTSETELVCNALARETLNPTPNATEPPPDPTLKVLDQLVSGVLHGTDLTPVRADVMRIISNQEDKTRIIATLIKNHDYHRINLLLQVRAEQENRLLRASRRGDLNTAEALAFFRLASGEIGKIVDSLREGGGMDGKTHQIVDTAAAMDKVDPARRDSDKHLNEAFKNTTPHGREIIRKRLYDLKLKQAGSSGK